MALARKNRLPVDRNSLLGLRKKGKALSTPLFSAFCLRSQTKQESRFCVIAGNKISKQAVVRNRIRRTIYQEIYKHTGHVKGVDMVIYPKQGIQNATGKQVQIEMAQLLAAAQK